MKSTAYIFSVRKSDKFRDKSFKFLLNYIKTEIGCEIIVVEQDVKPRFRLKKYGVKHIFLKNTGPFDKAWSYNVASQATKADKLIFGDADIYINAKHLKKCISNLDLYDVVDPKYFVWDLNEDQTNNFYKNNHYVPEYATSKMRKYVTVCGGIVMFQRQALEKIGGWTELCRGWGGEDDIQAIKSQRFLKVKKFPGRTFHLHHPTNEPQGNVMPPEYLNNIKMVDTYRNEIKNVEQIFDIEPDDLGNIDKYVKGIDYPGDKKNIDYLKEAETPVHAK